MGGSGGGGGGIVMAEATPESFNGVADGAGVANVVDVDADGFGVDDATGRGGVTGVAYPVWESHKMF